MIAVFEAITGSAKNVFIMKAVRSYREIIAEAKDAETEQRYDDATALYEQATILEPLNEYAYNRLMIIYRKEKRYQDELRVIDRGIRAFKDYHDNKTREFASSKTIIRLSNAWMANAGLTDKKGKTLYYPEPVPAWQKRKMTVQKKMK